MNKETLAENVKRIRKKQGMTQQQLADKIGWSRAEISRLECRKLKRVTCDFLDDIAKGLNVDVERLKGEGCVNE